MRGGLRVKAMACLRGGVVAGTMVTAMAVRARAWAMAAGMAQGQGESEGRETEGITYLDAGASTPQHHRQSPTSMEVGDCRWKCEYPAIPDFQWKSGIAELALDTTRTSTGCSLESLGIYAKKPRCPQCKRAHHSAHSHPGQLPI